MHRPFSLKSTECVRFGSCVCFMSYLWALFRFLQPAWEWEFLNWLGSSVATTPIGNTDITHLFRVVFMLPPRTINFLSHTITQGLHRSTDLVWHFVPQWYPSFCIMSPHLTPLCNYEASSTGLHDVQKEPLVLFYISFQIIDMSIKWYRA